eukprot:817417_1
MITIFNESILGTNQYTNKDKENKRACDKFIIFFRCQFSKMSYSFVTLHFLHGFFNIVVVADSVDWCLDCGTDGSQAHWLEMLALLVTASSRDVAFVIKSTTPCTSTQEPCPTFINDCSICPIMTPEPLPCTTEPQEPCPTFECNCPTLSHSNPNSKM